MVWFSLFLADKALIDDALYVLSAYLTIQNRGRNSVKVAFVPQCLSFMAISYDKTCYLMSWVEQDRMLH